MTATLPKGGRPSKLYPAAPGKKNIRYRPSHTPEHLDNPEALWKPVLWTD